jgi:hypothetical protein
MGFAKRKTKVSATSDPEKVLCHELELYRTHSLLQRKVGGQTVIGLDT